MMLLYAVDTRFGCPSAFFFFATIYSTLRVWQGVCLFASKTGVVVVGTKLKPWYNNNQLPFDCESRNPWEIPNN